MVDSGAKLVIHRDIDGGFYLEKVIDGRPVVVDETWPTLAAAEAAADRYYPGLPVEITGDEA